MQGDDDHESRGMTVTSAGDDGRECSRVINMSAGNLEGLLAWGL